MVSSHFLHFSYDIIRPKCLYVTGDANLQKYNLQFVDTSVLTMVLQPMTLPCCRWVHGVENEMYDTFERTQMYTDSLKMLKERLNILQQTHNIPHLYLTAVTEVVRRRTFSQSFLMVRNILVFFNKKKVGPKFYVFFWREKYFAVSLA